MVNLDFNDDIENQIRLRIIMAKYNEDNQLVHAYMLKSLLDVYIKNKIDIPDNVLKYINTNLEKLKHEIPFKIDEMKKKLNYKVNSDDEKLYEKPINIDNFEKSESYNSNDYKELTKSKKKSLFPEGYFNKSSKK